ncbi:MAG: aminotransferase class V-fold PLP-dependent enzyme [Kofleriaceae bacterium]|nr:aminotransferase class V-fold PLP-dependent enzyme [Kofleriaceae bacterium]
MFRSDDQILSMLPGPCHLREPVLRELAKQSEAYFQPYFDEQFVDPLLAKLKRVFQTSNILFVTTGGGRVGLETAVASTIVPGDRVVVINGGVFGEELAELATWLGGEVTLFDITPDQPLDVDALRAHVHRVRPAAVLMVHNETSTGSLLDVRAACAVAHEVDAVTIVDTVSSMGGIDCPTDDWGIDINVTASQKCLEGPAGLAAMSVSDRAWRKIEAAPEPSRAWTRDLRFWKNRWLPEAAGGRNPHRGRWTPLALPSQLICALSAGVDLVLAEGLQHRITRHAIAGRALEAGLAALGMTSIAGRNTSALVKCVSLPGGLVSAPVIELMLQRHRIRIASGFTRATCVRVSVIGATAEVGPIVATLLALEDTLAQLGHQVASPGCGARAAEDQLVAAMRTSSTR